MAAIAIAFSTGIAAAQFCVCYSFFTFAAAGILLAIAALMALRRNRLAVSFISGLAAIAAGGLLMAVAHRDGFSPADLRNQIARQTFPINEPVSFEGCIVEDSKRRGDDSVTTVELNAFLKKDRWIACEGKGILRIAQPEETSTAKSINLVRGDRIRGWAVWQRPRNYENPGSADRVGLLARRGIFALGRIKSARLVEKVPGDCSNPWTKFAAATSLRVQRSLDPLSKIQKGQPSAVLSSLVIGDYSGLNNTTREIFQNTGTYHVLVVSGLHVAWIAGLLLQCFRLIRIPDRARYLLAAVAIFFYTCVVGFQASITRCLWMFLLYLTARILFRRADAVNILIAAALILVAAQPDWLYEPGFQLSFLSVMAIAMTAVPAMQKYLKPLWEPLAHAGRSERLFLMRGSWQWRGRWLRTRCEIFVEEMSDLHPRLPSRLILWICRCIGAAGMAVTGMFLTSISIQLWLEPILAFNFNRMSWVAPLANLVMVPLSSIVLAAGIAATFAAGIPEIGAAALSLAGSLASLFLDSAAHIAEIGGAWQRCPTGAPDWIMGGVGLLFIWSFFEWRRFWIPISYIVILLACLACGSTLFADKAMPVSKSMFHASSGFAWSENAPILSFTFLDVGEGDAVVIRFPDKKTWLVDAGGLRISPSHEEGAYAFDIGEAVMSRYLWQKWIPRIDRLILSHADQDHAGGIPAVIKNFSVLGLGYYQNKPDPILGGVLKIAKERHVPALIFHAGMEERIGPVLVRVLHPRADSAFDTSNENSIVLHFSYRGFSALLTGDLEKAGERALLEQTPNLRSRLLKVAHHGSRSGTSHALLARVQPRWAIVSAGRNNPFGHPSREVMARLRHHGAQSFLTTDKGAIIFETDGNRYSIKSHVWGVLEQGDIG